MSPIAKDITSLPKASRNRDGHPPDEHPRYLATLADRLEQGRRDDGDLAHAVEGTRFRHSDAGKCARALSYKFAGIAPTSAPDSSGLWNFAVGHYGHEIFQAALLRAFGENARVETTCHIDGFDGSGHADAEITDDELKVCYELKTVGGFAFKMAVGERSNPEGPKWEHLVQGALNATAMGADRLVIGYLSKEAISVQAAARKRISELGRFMAEWTCLPEDFEPIAAAERARIVGILALVDDGLLAARKIPTPELPAGAEIMQPAKGLWETHDSDGAITDAGSWWACGYCDYQALCVQTQPGRIPVEVAVALRERVAA